MVGRAEMSNRKLICVSNLCKQYLDILFFKFTAREY